MKRNNYQRNGILPLVIGISLAVLIWSGVNYFMTSSDYNSKDTEQLDASKRAEKSELADTGENDEGFDIDNLEDPPSISGPVIHTEEYLVKKNSSVYDTLRSAGVSPAQIHAIITASADVFNLSKVRSGIKVLIQHHGDEKILNNIGFLLSATDTLWITKQEGSWSAKVESKPITMKIAAFQGDVNYSSWQSSAC